MSPVKRSGTTRRGACMMLASAGAVSMMPLASHAAATEGYRVLAANLARCLPGQSTRTVGARVLHAGLVPPDRALLGKALRMRVPEAVSQDIALPVARIAAALRASIEDDFGHGAVEFVDGWMLSTTECLAYGLVALCPPTAST